MNENIKDISKNLEILASNTLQLGLRKGLTGIALYFFFYARFSRDERYEEIANGLLERILKYIPKNNSYDFAHEFTDIGRTINFLSNEKFFEVEDDEFAGYFEESLILRMKLDVGTDFSFCYGITGLCDLFLNRENQEEALDITIKHLYSGLRVKGHPKHPIESVFLFPSEVLRDVKIFFLKLEKMNIPIPQKKLLDHAIRKVEFKKVLRSNCPEYSVLQDLREAEIIGNQQKIQSLLETIATTSSDLIFKGLASLSLADNSLPAWWKLV
ncbi:MAG: hypothetical protein LBR52_06585 [Prevotellaceae bacterium]|jgi:hypothetical protein|nr:hypothetical protein [Prevotellaceae bacterium]